MVIYEGMDAVWRANGEEKPSKLPELGTQLTVCLQRLTPQLSFHPSLLTSLSVSRAELMKTTGLKIDTYMGAGETKKGAGFQRRWIVSFWEKKKEARRDEDEEVSLVIPNHPHSLLCPPPNRMKMKSLIDPLLISWIQLYSIHFYLYCTKSQQQLP